MSGQDSGSPQTPKLVGFVYLVTNTVTRKKYVGQTTTSVERRWIQHLSSAKKGSTYAIHQAIRKYGKGSFTVECLERVEGCYSDLLAAEVRCIQAQDCLTPKGYNLTPGGEGVDFSDPVIRHKHAKAVREVSSRDSWRKAQFVGARKRLTDPEWQRKNSEALSALHSDPEWQARHKRHLASLHTDPRYVERQAQGVRQRSESTTWRENHLKAMHLLHEDPVYRTRVTESMRATKAAAALERDALYSPEEAARRARRRELKRLRYAKNQEARTQV